MANDMMVKELDQVVVRFSGDSGDGMQLAGNIFSTVSATVGNDISTFPDYPADIRAPQGSLTGVSGFQVHIGAGKVFTPGDQCDVLVAMNAAALKTQYKFAKSHHRHGLLPGFRPPESCFQNRQSYRGNGHQAGRHRSSHLANGERLPCRYGHG